MGLKPLVAGMSQSSAGGSGGPSDYIPKTANYTAVDKDQILADTSGGVFTILLPASPTAGQFVVIADAKSTWGTNNLTVGRNGQLIESTAANLTADVNGVQITLVFVGGGVGWRVLYQMAQATASTPPGPLWTWTAGGGVPAAGQFTTDNNAISATTTVKFHFTPKNGGDVTESLGNVPWLSSLILSNSSGAIVSAEVATNGNAGDGTFTVQNVTGAGNWSGDYQLSVWPYPQNITQIYSESSIVPVNDGTVTPVTSITTVKGIITAIS